MTGEIFGEPRLAQGIEMQSHGRARLSLRLDALATNWRTLASRNPRSACAGVVKANAYGLGIDVVVPTLRNAGCGTFFVASLDEARALRALDDRSHVYVLNGLPLGQAQAFAELSVRPVIGSHDELFEWASFQRHSGWRGAAALHVDTGMNRLGLTIEQARDVAQSPDRVPLSLVMSHLACADTPDNPVNARQIEAFSEVRRLFRSTPASLANSSGIFLKESIGLDLVRPGAALYGINPTPGERNPMQPVIGLSAPIIQVRSIGKGDSVGYGAAWTARRRSDIAIVALGYADGFFRATGSTDEASGGEAMVAGFRRPIIGRVSMDMIAVDVTGIPKEDTTRGSMVEFLSNEIGVDEVARHAGTIGYEFLTRLGNRFERVTVS
jgi:alanine racemase